MKAIQIFNIFLEYLNNKNRYFSLQPGYVSSMRNNDFLL